MSHWGKIGLFVGGVIFGTAGISILKSDDLKKAYTHCTAAALRGKECVMKTATSLKENCDDIYADAQDINEKRAHETEKKAIVDAKAKIEEAKAHLEELEAARKDAAADAEE